MTAERDRKLRNSQEINLTPEQKYILSLEEKLGRKEIELSEAKGRVAYLEDELFAQSAGFFLDEVGRRIGSGFKLNKLEGIMSKEGTTSFLDKLTNTILFAYAVYVFATAFLTRPRREYRVRRREGY